MQTPRPTASTSSTGCSRSAELDMRWPRVLGFEDGSGAETAGVQAGDQLVAVGVSSL